MEHPRVGLSPFQREEVVGLLAVLEDEFANGDDARIVWGALEGDHLTILDAQEAVEEILYRAEWMLDEGYVDGVSRPRQVAAYVRSLRSLAAKVQEVAG